MTNIMTGLLKSKNIIDFLTTPVWIIGWSLIIFNILIINNLFSLKCCLSSDFDKIRSKSWKSHWKNYRGIRCSWCSKPSRSTSSIRNMNFAYWQRRLTGNLWKRNLLHCLVKLADHPSLSKPFCGFCLLNKHIALEMRLLWIDTLREP